MFQRKEIATSAEKPALRIAIRNWQTDVELDLNAVQAALIKGTAAYKLKKAFAINPTFLINTYII